MSNAFWRLVGRFLPIQGTRLDIPYSQNVIRGRYLTVYPDDVFLVSYPRSGSTWLRFLLGNLLHPDSPTSFINLEARIPDVYRQEASALEGYPRPRILKSHEYFTPRYPRVIYLTRDPRDVAVSYYHWIRKSDAANQLLSLEAYLPGFMAGDFDAYSPWGDHVGSWLGARTHFPNRFLLVRYESLLDDPDRELLRVVTFLKLAPDRSALKRAIALSDIDHMRQLEAEQQAQWVTTQDTVQEIPFVWQGKAGYWREFLTAEMAAQIVSAWGHVMTQVGYEV